jgi:putative NADH-flavin reductase
MRLPALHDGEPGGSDREHDAVATVLIIGASRGIGLETVKTALEAGHSVRALARSARRIPVDHPKLEKMAGDALEMATVKRALTGDDVVTQSLGVSAGPETIFKPTRFFSQATRVLVTAMEQAHVKRLICVTGCGAGDSRGRGGFLYNAAIHLLLGRVYDDKDVQERIVRSSKFDWVIVRPVILTDGPKTNAYRALVDPRGWTCGFISRADVADFLVKQIDDTPFCIRRRCSRANSSAAATGLRASSREDVFVGYSGIWRTTGHPLAVLKLLQRRGSAECDYPLSQLDRNEACILCSRGCRFVSKRENSRGDHTPSN